MEGNFQKEWVALKCYTFREIVSVVVTSEYNWSTTPGPRQLCRGYYLGQMAVIGVGSGDTERVATGWFKFVLNTWPRRILLFTGEA